MPSRRHSLQTGPVYLANAMSSLNPAPLGRPATVVRDRSHVLDGLDLDARGLQGADGRLAAGARTLDADVQRTQARVLGHGGGGGGGLLGGEGRALARSLEPERARARPGHHVAFHVRDGHVRVVEGGVDVGHAVDDVALLLLGLLGARLLGRYDGSGGGYGIGHSIPSLRLGGGGGLGADERPARALARARVGVGALAAHGEVAAMAHPAVGADLHQPLDVHGDVLAEVAFDVAFLVDDLGDAAGFFLGEVLYADARVDPGLAEDLVRAAHADPVDVGQRDLHPLRAGQVHACDTCHLSLPLLVLLIRADDADHALAAHHLAFDADFPDRRPDLHNLASSLRAGHRPGAFVGTGPGSAAEETLRCGKRRPPPGGTSDFTRNPSKVILRSA